ncbi:MAG: hypothetical protein JWP03_3375 [Phycisphaerales bacterium]|nr:hypothetical protein [Phycisphaerales bacterium]
MQGPRVMLFASALALAAAALAESTPGQSASAEAGRKFWSFQPLAHPQPPATKDGQWSRTPIDRFVLAKMEEKGLSPNPIAPREKLIRRAYFDLLGVPPTPQEVAAFVADPSPDAYEKLLDRLLASPRYGERWARHWLDVARFAESDGFEHDSDRPAAYQYRDFVIRAFNEDMPFDRFAQWQIAGDELAPDDWQAMAATGFLTAGVFPTQITEKEFESTRYNQLDDMVSTVGTAMLGLTVGCARCHDHKFDPIPTADYYRMAATFATAIRSDVDLDKSTPAEREKAKSEWAQKRDAAREKLHAFEHEQLPAKFDAFVAQNKQNPEALATVWSVLDFQEVKTAHGTTLVKQSDGSLLKTGTPPAKETYTLVARTSVPEIAALRLEALTDKSLPHNGPGAGPNGNFALSEIEIQAGPADGSSPPVPVKIASAIATHEQNKGDLSVASSFDGKPETGWAVDLGGIGKDQAAIFRFDKPIGSPGGTLLTITLRFEHASAQHLIGRPRLSVTSTPEANDLKSPPGPDVAVGDALKRLIAGELLPDPQRDIARSWFASTLPEYINLKRELADIEARGPAKKLAKVQVTSEGLPPVTNFADGRGYPHFYPQVYLLKRGDANNKVEPVTPSFLHVLMRGGKDESAWQSPPPAGRGTSFRRAALARWLTDTDNGAGQLLARVIVNRVWQHHMGRGIVSTPNDFGAQGERPTNPELLDWLASDLIEHGWQLKRLHKLVMTSAVYMQGAQASPERAAIDPHDTYLWRWEPRRLEAEPIRDSVLAVSGLLDETMFGPGTLDQNMRRRSIYFTVKRSQLIPMLMVLDWPEPLNSIGGRPTTTVAPQALLFMNSPQARQYADGFAGRIKADSVADSVGQAYRIAFGRAPTKTEAEVSTAFIERQASSYQDAGRSDTRPAALADFCQALMSANEFVYVE